MIGGTILIGVGGGLSLMLLDQNSSKRTNINDLSFNTQLKIQVFEPSANLLTEDFKQINNNVLSIWDGIHFF
jgi:hypothetical protein